MKIEGLLLNPENYCFMDFSLLQMKDPQKGIFDKH
jgi:hypothetical protein